VDDELVFEAHYQAVPVADDRMHVAVEAEAVHVGIISEAEDTHSLEVARVVPPYYCHCWELLVERRVRRHRDRRQELHDLRV